MGETPKIRIGILAFQGCVTPHFEHLRRLGVEPVAVKSKEELSRCDGLILPGGESSVHLKWIEKENLEAFLKDLSQKIPFWGICAGSILMANHVSNPEQKSLGVFPVSIERNAYGRQTDSFVAAVAGLPGSEQYAWIRAPRIKKIENSEVKVLGTFQEDPIVLQYGQHLISTCHPELSEVKPSYLHKYFVELVRRNYEQGSHSKFHDHTPTHYR